MTAPSSQLWNKLAKSKKYRSAFAKAQFKRLVPFQIRALRKQRGWSQETLAANANLSQGVISRAEDPDYGNLTVNTILSIAEGFDVVLLGKFVPYSEFVRWYESLSEHLPPIHSFEEEQFVFGELEDRGLSTQSPAVPGFSQEEARVAIGMIPNTINVAAQIQPFSSGAVSNTISALKGRPEQKQPSAVSELRPRAAAA